MLVISDTSPLTALPAWIEIIAPLREDVDPFRASADSAAKEVRYLRWQQSELSFVSQLQPDVISPARSTRTM